MHRVNPNFENDAKMASVMGRLEALRISKGAQSSGSEPSMPVVSHISILYDINDHLVK